MGWRDSKSRKGQNCPMTLFVLLYYSHFPETITKIVVMREHTLFMEVGQWYLYVFHRRRDKILKKTRRIKI